MELIPDTRRKALKINLDGSIYGTFAEIGAGQEVARHFFMAGAASGTIAKTMSAYDMTFSNAIYGQEDSGRYVSKSRLTKMLDHEYELLTERLCGEKYESKTFFAFANTVTTLNYSKTNDPHGWIGIRFQLAPQGESNEILFHVRLLDSDASLQQNVLGILGVNLVYAAYCYHGNPKAMVESLADNLSQGSVEIDLISVKGPAFSNVDDILINLYLIQKGYSSAAIFNPEGEICQAKDMLYKKYIMIWRTRYRQNKSIAPLYNSATQSNTSENINQNVLFADKMFKQATKQFKYTHNIKDEEMVALAELTLNNLLHKVAIDNENDLLATVVERAKTFMGMGHHVLISDFSRNNQLAQYLSICKPCAVGITTNVVNIKHIFTADNYNNENYTNELLAYVSDLFSKNVKLFVYPYKDMGTQEIINSKNVSVSVQSRLLYDFLIQNNYITDIEDYTDTDVIQL